MTMRRGGAAVRERNSLRRAINAMAFLCPDCGSRDAKVEWNASHRRYRIAVYHDVTCPVLDNRPLKESVDRYVRDALVAAGHFLSDYNDHDVAGLHRAIPSRR